MFRPIVTSRRPSVSQDCLPPRSLSYTALDQASYQLLQNLSILSTCIIPFNERNAVIFTYLFPEWSPYICYFNKLLSGLLLSFTAHSGDLFSLGCSRKLWKKLCSLTSLSPRYFGLLNCFLHIVLIGTFVFTDLWLASYLQGCSTVAERKCFLRKNTMPFANI